MPELPEHVLAADATPPRLSILVAALTARDAKAVELINVLMPQIHRFADRVELLGYRDNGEKTVGYKRQVLLDRAKGDYVCFIDDDDLVDDDYVEAILKALESSPDCVPLQVQVIAPNGQATARIIQSRQCGKTWRSQGREWTRSTNHLNPVRRSLALAAGFCDMDAMEDRDYAVKLRSMLSNESSLLSPLPTYIYRHDPSASSTPNFSPRLFANRFGGDYDVALRVRGRSGGTVKVETWPPHVNWAGMVVDGQRIGVVHACGWRSITVGNYTVHTEPWTAQHRGPTRLKLTCDGDLVFRMPPVKCVVGGRVVQFP